MSLVSIKVDSLRKLSFLLQLGHTIQGRLVQCICSQRLYCSRSLYNAAEDSENNATEDQRVPAVGMTSNGRTLICWHPEPKHPYHHTMPLSRDTLEASKGDSTLNPKLLRDEALKYRPDGPNIRELANMTFTTKHRWFNFNKRKFRKLNPPKDRDRI